MSRRALDAAGITDPALRDAYAACLRLNSRRSSSLLLVTRLLPLRCRPAIHALYCFASMADAIVDDHSPRPDKADREAALDRLRAQLDTALLGDECSTPPLRAVAHTLAHYDIDLKHMDDFMDAMRADLTVTDYPDYQALRKYCYGCAAAPGLMTLPVMGTVTSHEEATPHAIAYAMALQLTNILRDIGEDLDLGRLYLPKDLLDAHDVDRPLLEWSRRTGRGDHRITAAAKDFADLVRIAYRAAAPGITVLVPQVRPPLQAAHALYAAILDQISQSGYNVLHRRIRVPRRRRAAIAVHYAGRMLTNRSR